MGDLGIHEIENLKGVGEREEEEDANEVGVRILDFDLLCATVALQTQKGNWQMLKTTDEMDELNAEYGAAFRMWEGELLDCLENPRVAIQTSCCPCFPFGKNMKRAGFGPCMVQGGVYLLLILATVVSLSAFLFAKVHLCLFIGLAFLCSIGTYSGFFRSRIRKKFNIKGSESVIDDCIIHIACPCCSLLQESRTLEMNNVEDGQWHGRGDTICLGGGSIEHKLPFQPQKMEQ